MSIAPLSTDSKSGQLHTALATWIFLLTDAGQRPDDAGIAAAVQALRDAPDDVDPDALGAVLVDAVAAKMGTGERLADITDFLGALFGRDHFTTQLGEDRADRIRLARRHQFASNLPWLVRIIDRFPGRPLGAHWLLVERVDDQVVCMDPYPWDDLDEQYSQPTVEFMVKWELAGCEGVRFQA